MTETIKVTELSDFDMAEHFLRARHSTRRCDRPRSRVSIPLPKCVPRWVSNSLRNRFSTHDHRMCAWSMHPLRLSPELNRLATYANMLPHPVLKRLLA
jgi:hypothetical protein